MTLGRVHPHPLHPGSVRPAHTRLVRAAGIVCEPPPDIPRGTHSGHSLDAFPYAAVVTYTCEPGHALAGAASIFCTTADGERGEWSGPPPRCGGRACGARGRHSQGTSVPSSVHPDELSPPDGLRL